MPTFQIELEDGRKLSIDADNQEAALAGAQHYSSQPQGGGLAGHAKAAVTGLANVVAAVPDSLFSVMNAFGDPERVATLRKLQKEQGVKPTLSEQISNPIIGDYEPKGAEKYTQAITSMGPSTIPGLIKGGAAAVPRAVVRGAVVPGALSEGAGDITGALGGDETAQNIDRVAGAGVGSLKNPNFNTFSWVAKP